MNRFVSLSALLLTGACAVGPDYVRPDVTTPGAFKETATFNTALNQPVPAPETVAAINAAPTPEAARALAKAKPQDDAVRGKWWETFGDDDLNKLEEQVASANQTVKAAEASFRQARALVAEARASFFPTVGATGSVSRGGGSSHINSATGISSGGAPHNSYAASLDASWVPDFWGKVRRELESSEAGAQASAANLATATLSAQAELAIDYLELRMADEQKRLLEASVAAYAKSLEITQNQYKAGIVVSSDVLQAKTQLESAQAQLIDVGVARAQFEHAIAVLIGRAPADFSIVEINNVPALPDTPDAVPSELLERRPDIASAERTVASANAQIGVAEAAYFPDITLSASGGYNSSTLANWFSLPNRFWSIGPTLAETIFDAGLRSAQTEAAIATYDQTVANYRQTVLTAFQAVEDNLAQLRIYAQEAATLDAEVQDAKQSLEVSLNQYKSGTVSYLNVVTAQTASLNAELTALNVRKARLVSMATLIQNLGGGWHASELDKPDVPQGETTPLSILPPSVK